MLTLEKLNGLAAYLVIGLAISFVVPFPLSFGIALLVYFAPNAARMHLALKRQGMPGGIKDGRWSNSDSVGMGYSPIKFCCMNCGYEHREYTCPNVAQKL